MLSVTRYMLMIGPNSILFLCLPCFTLKPERKKRKKNDKPQHQHYHRGSNQKEEGIWNLPENKTHLPVTIGTLKSILNRDKMAVGDPCILFNGQWVTPPVFLKQGTQNGRSKWKENVFCQDTPLGKLLKEGHLICPGFLRKQSVHSGQMPLSKKEKAARHRQRILNDPAARDAYLAKRKESYQRWKREGKILKPRISQLSRTEQEKLKQQWKPNQRKHRERKRATEEILNFTPLKHESLDTTPTEPPAEPQPPPADRQPNPPNIHRENIVSVDVMQPRASSTPQRVASTTSNKKSKRKKAKMRSEMHKMKRVIEAGKRENEKLQKCIQRLRAKKKAKSTTEKIKESNEAILQAEKGESCLCQLCRDENKFTVL